MAAINRRNLLAKLGAAPPGAGAAARRAVGRLVVAAVGTGHADCPRTSGDPSWRPPPAAGAVPRGRQRRPRAGTCPPV